MRLIAAWLLLAVTTASASADVVRLVSGSQYVGRILELTPVRVTIETKLGSIRAEVTFDRADVAQITRAPLPDGFFDTPAATAPPVAAGRSARYLEVPIDGSIGREALAGGLRDALGRAVRLKVDCVVLTVDSDEGDPDEALAMAEALAAHADALRLVAVVQQARGPAVAAVLACHEILMRPRAALGEAADIPADEGDPWAPIDPSASQAFARQLASIAAQRGHNVVLAQAMAEPDSIAYAWRESGGWRIDAALDAPGAAEQIALEGGRKGLLLEAELAWRLGVARRLDGGVEAVGGVLGFAGWKSPGNQGIDAMADAAAADRAAREHRARVAAAVGNGAQRALNTLSDIEAEARRNEPTRFYDYRYLPSGNVWDLQSRRKWVDRTDRAIREWRTLIARLREVEAMLAEARELDLPVHPALAALDARNELRQAAEAIRRLEAERNRLR